MFGRVLRLLSGRGVSKHAERSAAAGGRRGLLARFDSAADTPDMRRHWENADGLSANAALTPDIQRKLRNRARYECLNNGYAAGIADTLALHVVGKGAQLQVQTDVDKNNSLLEEAWEEWAADVGLWQKIALCRRARVESGEAFAVITNNGGLPGPVTLDLQILESDQCGDPWGAFTDPARVDGITYDEWGNPAKYTFFRAHPGSNDPRAIESYDVAARNVIHYFRPIRPGQGRGIPEITPSLTLFGNLRRFTLATLLSAEHAANVAAAIQSDAPPDGPDELPPNVEMQFERGMAITLPLGWKLSQIAAEHPNTTYVEFVRALIREAARPVHMPLNIAMCDSSNHNYSSGKLDHQTYGCAIDLDRFHIEQCILRRVFAAWLSEAVLVEGLLPQPFRMRARRLPKHEWGWRVFESIDPLKDAKSATERLLAGISTLAFECAKLGLNWREVVLQRAREDKLLDELGLVRIVDVRRGGSSNLPKQDDDATEDDAAESEKEKANATA
jgi:lambda family phage portal protein